MIVFQCQDLKIFFLSECYEVVTGQYARSKCVFIPKRCSNNFTKQYNFSHAIYPSVDLQTVNEQSGTVTLEMDTGPMGDCSKMIVEDETTELVLELTESSVQNTIIMGHDTSLAPVIIEELEESEIADVNMSEFVEARALKVRRVGDSIADDGEVHTNEFGVDPLPLDTSDVEDHDVLTPEEEDLLTTQFLNGELTFSEYSLRMDKSIDLEGAEAENARFVSHPTMASKTLVR